ncbi:MAG: DDE-type integrase/transposase/recombinase [Silvibacterium sp.]
MASDRTPHYLSGTWYLRYSLSLRDVDELLEERGLHVNHTTVLALGAGLRPGVGATTATASQANKQVLAGGRNLRSREGSLVLLVPGHRFQGCHHFLLSTFRNADAAKRLFRKALGDRSHPQPRVINTDLAPIYSSAIPDSKKEGTLRKRCRHRPVQYLNNILEQDHRAIKRRMNAKQGFRESKRLGERFKATKQST